MRGFGKFKCLIMVLVGMSVMMSAQSSARAQKSFAILAVSWQPAFCEKRSDRPECRSQTKARYDASHFSLHGLWPGPRSNAYCNISSSLKSTDKSGRWGRLPDLNLDGSLRSRLDQVMPGTRSYLHRHEWVKHGTCHEDGSAGGYFEDSVRLMDELNKSVVQTLFVRNIGKYLSRRQIEKAFDQSFGRGAGKRVRISCRRDGDRLLISELTIGLYGIFDENTSMAQLIQAARPTDRGCKGGIVDPVGLQ